MSNNKAIITQAYHPHPPPNNKTIEFKTSKTVGRKTTPTPAKRETKPSRVSPRKAASSKSSPAKASSAKAAVRKTLLRKAAVVKTEDNVEGNFFLFYLSTCIFLE